ncbi:hypothetical protein FACS1894172_12520 [Spirochaetia bacterium]|nr:hypothetical protein FACS1894164_02440 [Spirochaetia bacterium]GHU33627.1 hypothetical protein FACS1894172_12520 [Spirochaetia bacterium]
MIQHYTSKKITGPITIDGNLHKPVWHTAEKSPRFVDMVSGKTAFFDTHIASVWDEEYLYVAYWVEEPLIRANCTERDSFVWFDNDVEFFLEGQDCYYELEINAHNTVYENFFIWHDALKKGSRFDVPDFDLYTHNVDILAGFQDASRYAKHPRGKRWAFMDYDLPGLQTAVNINGAINTPDIFSQGWTVELAIPWKSITPWFEKRHFPPAHGDILRAAFFRFEALEYHGKIIPESIGWALNEHGVYDSHLPEHFSYLHFDSGTV